MKKKQLTEAQAWRAIAKKLLREGRVAFGLCFEVRQLNFDGIISDDTHATMDAHLEQHVEWFRFALQHGEFHEERAMAALWLALEAQSGA